VSLGNSNKKQQDKSEVSTAIIERSSTTGKEKQYDEDFSQTGSSETKTKTTTRKLSNKSSSDEQQQSPRHSKPATPRSSSFKAPSSRKVRDEDEENDEDAKSTMSEISEQLIVDSLIKKNGSGDDEDEGEEAAAGEGELGETTGTGKSGVSVLNRTDDEEDEQRDREDMNAKLAELVKEDDDDDSESSSSSSASSSSDRSAKPAIVPIRKQPAAAEVIAEEDENENEDEDVNVTLTSPPKNNEKLADRIEDLLLSQAIDQIIEVRDRKLVKMTTEEVIAEAAGARRLDFTALDDLKTPSTSPQIPPIDLFAEPAAEEVKKPPVYCIPYTKEKVSALCDLAVESYFWKHLSDMKPLLETNHTTEVDAVQDLLNTPELAGFFASSLELPVGEEDESRARKLQSELNFKRMLIDLIGELVYDLYVERYELEESLNAFVPCLRKRVEKRHFKSVARGPIDLAKAQALVRNRVLSLVKLQSVSEEAEAADNARRGGLVRGGKLSLPSATVSRSKWKVMKKLDLVDTLLDREMREQEYEWSNYDIEEYEAKLLVANTVFDMLLKDTIDGLKGAITSKINLIN
jgi:hypothetical protein